MITAKIVKGNIKKILANHNMGIRFDTCKTVRKIGSSLPCSWDWEAEKKTRLSGTCAISVDSLFSFNNTREAVAEIEKSLNSSEKYSYNHIYLISGESYEHGNDSNEIIISNAEVVGIIEIFGEKDSTKKTYHAPINEAAIETI